MSTTTIPPGADLLASRLAEIQAHPYGNISRQPTHAGETLFELLKRVAALGSNLAAVDGAVNPSAALVPIVAQLGANRVQSLVLGLELTWKAMEALIIAMLAIEARLTKLDATGFPLGVLDSMADQVKLNGRLSKYESSFYEALQLLVGRVMSAEARLASLAGKTS